MRRALTAVVAAALVGGLVYWYQTAYSGCRVPIVYDIGTLDERFGVSRDGVRAAVSEAESLWEDATGRNLFTYSEGADFTINFIFDERQQETYEEQGLRDLLDQKEGMSEGIRGQYEALVEEYEELRASYELRVSAYENRLATHNGEVAYWNNQGGAPSDVYERLNETQGALDTEQKALNRIVRDLNQLVDGINILGERGNTTVRDYNENVEAYNERFTESREFTQGDYRGDHINIYQFNDTEELRLVLAHELGHALSLEHVEDERSVMYFLMEGQLADATLSDADLAEFSRVCGTE